MPVQVRQAIAIVRITDFQKRFAALKRPCFSRAEQKYCASRPRAVEHFAARLAAKQAALKLLPKHPKPRYAEVEVLRQPLGYTDLKLSSRILSAHPFLKNAELHVSLSHDSKLAGAAVIFIYEKTES